MKTYLSKKDKRVIVAVVILSVVIYLFCGLWNREEGARVVVKVDGNIQGIYSLKEDRTIRVNHGKNIVEIKNGRAVMKEASCPDQLCVHQKGISGMHETIVCLPNKVVIEIEGEEAKTDSPQEIDSVAE